MNRIRLFGNTPPVIKNLLIINAIMLFATMILADRVDLTNILGMHFYKSQYFVIYQVVTHMFMHGGFLHLFLNMYALWMFGQILEFDWGSKRFLTYYMITGIGAILFQTLVNSIHYSIIHAAIVEFSAHPTPDLFAAIVNKHFSFMAKAEPSFISDWAAHLSDPAYARGAINELNSLYTKLIDVPTVGASGAVFGVLLAFGMLHPNTELMFIFPPMPVKAKWVVLGYGAAELYSGVQQPGSNIAHFAHLGGMLFGFILIKYWQANRKTFY